MLSKDLYHAADLRAIGTLAICAVRVLLAFTAASETPNAEVFVAVSMSTGNLRQHKA